jgi:hypothetical protein
LFLIHFKAVAGQHVTVAMAYAPIDVSNASVKDAFHLFLFSYLKAVLPIDKVVVLSEFNTKLGHGWDSSISMVG